MAFNKLRTDIKGKHYLDDELLTPELLSQESRQIKRKGESEQSYKFRLLTIRRLTERGLDEVYNELLEDQSRLESAALATGSPTPYPAQINRDTLDLKQSYGVYVDEDIKGDSEPVFSFTASSPNIKAFIVSTGAAEDEYVIHLCFLVDKYPNPEGLSTTIWRLVTLESNQNGVPGIVIHSIDSTALPESFSFNLDVDSIQYLGGGTWTAFSLDKDDRIPLYGNVSASDPRYKPIGTVRRYLGVSAVQAIVNYSITPTYSMTWNRGELKLSKRSREVIQEYDSQSRSQANVIKFNRFHRYEMNLCERPERGDTSEVVRREFVEANATYVGSTNARINSPFQSPDYGTDVRRFSMSEYTQESNILRPKSLSRTYNLNSNKHSRQRITYIPVLAASSDMAVYLRINQGIAKGSIKHPDEVKQTRGKRGISFHDYYPYWWTYGQVLSVIPTGDTSRYRILKSPLPGTSDRIRVGDILDEGELLLDPEVGNRIVSTWTVPANPPTGFFGLFEGSVNFIITYISPPLIGHQGVYYYEIQPRVVGLFGNNLNRSYYGDFKSGIPAAADAAGSFRGIGATPQDRQNSLLLLYSQMIGALGGGAVSSLNIGNVSIASRDSESIVVSEPNPSQRAALGTEPSTFPVGFFENTLDYGLTLDNNNNGTFFFYNSSGELTSSTPIVA